MSLPPPAPCPAHRSALARAPRLSCSGNGAPRRTGLLRGISLGLVTGVLRLGRDPAVASERDAAIREELLQRRIEIARDLHDTVALEASPRSVLQARGGRTASSSVTRAAARVALGHVEEAARGANADLRRMLEALRAPDDARPMAPEPGLADLPVLIDDFRHGRP